MMGLSEIASVDADATRSVMPSDKTIAAAITITSFPKLPDG